MSLLDYERRFADLNLNRSTGQASPHKVAMLLAVMELIDNGTIVENEIYYNDALTTAFSKHFAPLRGARDHDNPYLPFFHLKRESFWHHQPRPGQRAAYENLKRVTGPGTIDQYILYARVDDVLFELLANSTARQLLTAALHQNVVIGDQQRQALLDVGQGWNWLECEAAVDDYFAMLFKQLAGQPLNKAAHNRQLQQKLNNRSKGAVEFKHQNISAIMIDLGQPFYLTGYKPAYNYQAQLKQAVQARLACPAQWQDLAGVIDTAIQAPEQAIAEQQLDWDKVLDPDLPEPPPPAPARPRKFLAYRTDYAAREARNRSLGNAGEQFVVALEQHRLRQAGRDDLAEEVLWSSKEKGDGLGYDVRSFVWRDNKPIDTPHFIEVKTTNSGKHQPFFITDNELAYAREYADQYSLYRVFDFNRQARIYRLAGAVEQHLKLQPTTYRASF
ncbi:uncharacterized protein DUF3883 [Sinobacterium caligoides]|uniref:Uncharacterized protein DUF3883 n=1 Tax=Sinobacterium caligoides TaxID=933926 RepID=A0A3N2DLI6_9GAMM|nr:DUF3883 domain-containing protein [Sinobacterium caligoides]ROS00215.1 uncharacterized protein DUF3883 [Sinobacterium caligoides]